MAASPAPGNYVDATDTQGGVVTYRIRFTSPGASSPTTFTANSQITSVTYSGTGVYTIVLGSAFFQVLETRASIKQASYSASGACGARWTSDTTATVVLTTETAAGAAVATASGDVVTFTIVVGNYRTPSNS